MGLVLVLVVAVGMVAVVVDVAAAAAEEVAEEGEAGVVDQVRVKAKETAQEEAMEERGLGRISIRQVGVTMIANEDMIRRWPELVLGFPAREGV